MKLEKIVSLVLNIHTFCFLKLKRNILERKKHHAYIHLLKAELYLEYIFSSSYLLVQNPVQFEQEEEYLGSSKQEVEEEEMEEEEEGTARVMNNRRISSILCQVLGGTGS